ncbi:hypothetical protein N7508_006591 [Penicillium antarcticum]|uniref:uncharacterized protein n=1 Tax=Penicillium antarcticum TaxID=416450 RepID=UPI002398C1F7|nr:uncharacterized protein N7508_006591 [Penicillium antarcticum]KAJ5301728.1 hypothetical protein N7508_006591 [Penicillium antarcticum]
MIFFLNPANKNSVVSNDTTAFIYSTDKKPELDLHLAHSRRGREVSAYLSYVIDYYDNLPLSSIFIHADEKQRHNDLFGPKTSVILENLRHEAIEVKGYLNLRCMHTPGCPSHVAPNNPTKEDIKADDARAHFAQIYRELFGMNVVVPDLIGAPCCAQFATVMPSDGFLKACGMWSLAWMQLNVLLMNNVVAITTDGADLWLLDVF